MKKAIIYVRVSTDEQSERGYSLQHQEDRLKQYCQHNDIEIVGLYKEDHSAKSFERPAFNEILTFLKRNKNYVDLLLFLKWDRFSRNAGDAYMMINRLGKLGVEPQAIEQPLDLEIPENKIMLAFYLAAPEVENDRRSLNVIAGMRRAMKDGRYVTVAPKGYKNVRNEMNRPIIVPGKDAPLVKWLFEEVAKNVYSVKDVWRLARKQGLNVSRSNVWYLLRNPIYCGKIYLPAHKDELAQVVPGLHEPIISENLFYDVQDVLDGRKRKVAYQHTAKEELPLRGFLYCPRCGKRLTGSAVNGNGGKYFYYHCLTKCGERVRADLINQSFEDELKNIVIKQGYITLFEAVMKDYYQKSCKEGRDNVATIKAEIEKNKLRINNAQQLMLDGELKVADFKEIKQRYEPVLHQLERKQKEITGINVHLLDYINETVDLLQNISIYYNKARLPVKQKLIGSICKGKLIFKNNNYQTIELNEVIELIRRLGGACKGNKNGQAGKVANLSEEVTPLGFKPITFPTSVGMLYSIELRKIKNLSKTLRG